MALVKFSKDCKERTREIIDRMRRNEHERLPYIETIYIDPADPRVAPLVFGEHAHLLPHLPKQWLQQRERIIIKFKTRVLLDAGDGKTNSVEPTFILRSNVPDKGFTCPPTDTYNCTRTYDTLEEMIAVWPEFSEWKANVEARVACTAKWNKIRDDVIKFFEAFPSVNAALKHTPAMMMYLDPEDVARMERKVERSRPQDAAPAVDVGALVGAAVGHRLGV